MPVLPDQCRRSEESELPDSRCEVRFATSVLVDIAQGIGYSIYRDGSIFLASRFEAFLNHFLRYEWAHAIVNAHYAIFIIRNECQSVFG